MNGSLACLLKKWYASSSRMKILPTLVSLASIFLSNLQAGEKFTPEFYAFTNGVPSLSYDEEARLLKKLGFDGISQVHAGDGGEKLAERIAAFDKQGLKVLSIYLDAGEQPIDPKVYQALANRSGMIELTVTTINPKVIDSIRKTAGRAGEMKIRVALYPHFGNAVATMPQALALIEKINHPNVGVMFNLCHFLKSENPDDLEEVLGKAAPHLFSVSTCGADADGTTWARLIQPLNEGSFPQSRLLNHLQKLNYTGPVTLQCYAIKGDRQKNLQASIAAWKKLTSSDPGGP